MDFYEYIEDNADYVSIFLNGLHVPWKLLSLSDFIKYQKKYAELNVPHAHIEDAIFKTCVLDTSLVENIYSLPAGVVTTTVRHILESSGFESPEQIAYDMNIARMETDNFIHYCAALVCQTFPGYKIQDVLDLSYPEFLNVVSLAERRLMALGVISEPIQPVHQNELEQPPITQAKFADLNKHFERVELPQPQPIQKPKGVITEEHIQETQMEYQLSLNGHDRLESGLETSMWQHDALEGWDVIYPELAAMMKRGERITPEMINQTKGMTQQEIKAKHKEYQKKLKDGTINYRPSEPAIAWGKKEAIKQPKQQKRRRVRRR